MKFPSPVAIEGPDLLVYTSKVEDQPPETGSGIVITWDKDTDQPHMVQVAALSQNGDTLEGPITGNRGTLILRPLDPYDGVVLSAARVPHPIEVLRAQILAGGNMVATELAAAVAPDNSVVTLILETGLGTYVRYMGDWQLLSSDSQSLEDLQFLTVSPAALPIFDKADAANTPLTSSDLPRYVLGDEVLPADYLPEVEPLAEPVVAAGTHIPVIISAADLPAAITVAHYSPAIRWYVTRRAAALGEGHLIPEDW